jgi:hypothetical protein
MLRGKVILSIATPEENAWYYHVHFPTVKEQFTRPKHPSTYAKNMEERRARNIKPIYLIGMRKISQLRSSLFCP